MRLERYYDSIFASVATLYSTIFHNKILFMEYIQFLNYIFSKLFVWKLNETSNSMDTSKRVN